MIGIFDSGMGGLTVLAEAIKISPNEDYIYVGDSFNAPYGTKTQNQILEYSKKICNYLIDEYNVKAIIIACNTATSVAIQILRDSYNIPIIGMEPAIKPALENKNNHKILVIATEMTLKEEKYNKLIKKYNGNNRIISLPCSELVSEIEKAEEDRIKTFEIIDKCIDNNHDIDAIVLGCTHFLFIKKHILDKYNNKYRIYDGNEGTIVNLQNILLEEKFKTKKIGKVIIENTLNETKVKLSKKIFDIYYQEIKNG